MSAVIRLVTVVDIDDGPVPIDAPLVDGPPPEGAEPAVAPLRPRASRDDSRSISLSAVHLAVLQNGRRLTLLDDRGWTSSGPPDLWRQISLEDVEETARMVVGPDEPFGTYTATDMAAEHWSGIADTLRQHGVLIEGARLSQLPHDVELTGRLRRRLVDT